MKSLLALLLVSTTPAFAQVSLPQSGLAPVIQQKVAATVLVLDEPNSYCTVTPITQDGYMLTALHCVRSCLTTAGVGENASNSFLGLQDLFVSNRSKTGGMACPTLSVPALGAKGVTVVATGSALSVFSAHFMFDYPTLYNELKSRGFASRTNDFAIIKIATAKPLKCLSLNAAGAAAGSQIWAAGYPLPENEKVKPTLQLSPGRVYTSAQDSKFFAQSQSEQERVYLASLYSESGVLYSNATTQFGQSGGPVIAADGSIVGVVSGFTKTDAPEVHELVAVSSASFLRALPPALAQDLLRKSAACH